MQEFPEATTGITIHDGSGSFDHNKNGVTTTTTEAYTIRLEDVNEAPVLAQANIDNTGTTITEDADSTIDDAEVLVLTTDMIKAADEDKHPSNSAEDDLANLTYIITDVVNGKMQRQASDGTWSDIAEVTQGNGTYQFSHADLIGGNIRFVHDGGEETGVDAAGFADSRTPHRPALKCKCATRNGLTSAAAVDFTIATVTPVNDAPTLTTTIDATDDTTFICR